MSNRASEPPGSLSVPPRQHNFEQAARLACGAVRAQSDEQLVWLGARREGVCWRLQVLDDSLSIDAAGEAVLTSAGRPVGAFWKVLVLHYLAVAERPGEGEPLTKTFAALAGGRAYAPVYQARVIGRLCGTFGNDAGRLRRAGLSLGARETDAGDVGLDFQVFPRLRVRLAWYAGDEELECSAAVLLPENIERWLAVEDIVVLSERLVSRLAGGAF